MQAKLRGMLWCSPRGCHSIRGTLGKQKEKRSTPRRPCSGSKPTVGGRSRPVPLSRSGSSTAAAIGSGGHDAQGSDLPSWHELFGAKSGSASVGVRAARSKRVPEEVDFLATRAQVDPPAEEEAEPHCSIAVLSR